MRTPPLSAALLLGLLCLPNHAAAQGPGDAASPWSLRVRAVISGTSYESEPAGYKICSGIGLEAAIARSVSDVAALELAFRTESREVLGPEDAGGDHRLGSLEMLPVTLLVQWRPRGRGDADLQPYLGAGLSLTTTWEKSGALDSSSLPPSLDPAVQLGADWTLSARTGLNLDVKWNALAADIQDFRSPDPSVKIDPLTLGLGVGVRF